MKATAKWFDANIKGTFKGELRQDRIYKGMNYTFKAVYYAILGPLSYLYFMDQPYVWPSMDGRA